MLSCTDETDTQGHQSQAKLELELSPSGQGLEDSRRKADGSLKKVAASYLYRRRRPAKRQTLQSVPEVRRSCAESSCEPISSPCIISFGCRHPVACVCVHATDRSIACNEYLYTHAHIERESRNGDICNFS